MDGWPSSDDAGFGGNPAILMEGVAEFAIIAVHLYILNLLLMSALSGSTERRAWRRWILLATLAGGLLQTFHSLAVTQQSAAWLLSLSLGLGGGMSLLALATGRIRMTNTVMGSLLMLGFLGASSLALLGAGTTGLSSSGALLFMPEIFIFAGGVSYMIAAAIALKLETGARRELVAVSAYCACMAMACLVLVLVSDYRAAHAWASLPRFLAGGAIGWFAWSSYQAAQLGGRTRVPLVVAKAAGTVGAQKPTILAVDDDPAVLELMQAVFSELGTVSSATSRREVEALLADGNMPDLVVLDLHLEDGRAHDLVPAFFGDLGAAKRLLIYSVDRYPSQLLPRGAQSLVKSETPIDRLRDIAAGVLSTQSRSGLSLSTAG